KMRAKLGESLASVQKYDAPLENVTTPSLEALQAFSLGMRSLRVKNDSAAAMSFYQRAISFDPNFARAYANLGICYLNLGQTALAEENIRKAYALRDRVSEHEKLYLVSDYQLDVTGNLEASRKTLELWIQTYPRDGVPHNFLGIVYAGLGDYEKALAQEQERLRLDPGLGIAYGNLAQAYRALGRLGEAKAV